MNVSVVTERRTPAYSSLAAGELNGLVARALLTEAADTKPGLVDIRNRERIGIWIWRILNVALPPLLRGWKSFYHGQQHGGAGGRKMSRVMLRPAAGDGLLENDMRYRRTTV